MTIGPVFERVYETNGRRSNAATSGELPRGNLMRHVFVTIRMSAVYVPARNLIQYRTRNSDLVRHVTSATGWPARVWNFADYISPLAINIRCISVNFVSRTGDRKIPWPSWPSLCRRQILHRGNYVAAPPALRGYLKRNDASLIRHGAFRIATERAVWNR